MEPTISPAEDQLIRSTSDDDEHCDLRLWQSESRENARTLPATKTICSGTARGATLAASLENVSFQRNMSILICTHPQDLKSLLALKGFGGLGRSPLNIPLTFSS